ncbi:hypothetical protein [Streptomyces phaeochromogenes]|uniref:hypothetical protein n=1 Tax=Streptomyces phaeochromogenes TaxID=1923 RepID=UPI0033D942CC
MRPVSLLGGGGMAVPGLPVVLTGRAPPARLALDRTSATFADVASQPSYAAIRSAHSGP